MIRYIMPVILLCVSMTKGMEPPLLNFEHQILTELRKVLKEEREKKGTFIKKIINSLKECTNGKMIELQYLTIKPSYWWDKKPQKDGKRGPYIVDKFHDEKELIIDRKFLSSVYDREIQGSGTKSFPNRFAKHQLDTRITTFLNSWESAKEKAKFFYNEELGPNTIPDSLKGIMGSCKMTHLFHMETWTSLDMHPSVYQMMQALKTLDYEKKEEPLRCPASTAEIAGKDPSRVILDGVDVIFKQPYYNHFIKQNHLLSKIVQNHLEKLKYKAEQTDFKTNSKKTNEYSHPILYDKILKQMGYIIQLMSVFNIDMDAGRCDIPTSDEWGDDKPRNTYYLYAQFYEIFNDLLFLLMSVDNQYNQKDFDRFLTNAYINRFPIFKDLSENKDLIVASYPMRSGMDAFVNACMAIGFAPQDISIAPKVKNLENTVYYEISNLSNEYPNRGEIKATVFLSQKPNSEEVERIKDVFVANLANDIIDEFILTNKKMDQYGMSDFGEFEISKYARQVMYIIEGTIDGDKLRVGDKGELNEEQKELIKKSVSPQRKKLFSEKDLLNLKETKEGFYFEIPVSKRVISTQDKKYEDVLKNYDHLLRGVPLVENIFLLDKHLSITTGMTTDTVDISHDPAYMDKLHRKINKIRSLKQSWNESEDPFIILWDTTMEIDKGPCYSLMNKFRAEIESGKVIFVLFKSLQKYANLGIGKTRAGVVTLVGKKSPTVENINNKLTYYGKDVFSHSHEYALMTFFYDPSKQQDSELFYYQAVEKNAQKIHSLYPTKYTKSSGCLFTSEDSNETGMPYSDTFGFAIPTVTGMFVNLCRYSVGLNPKGLK